MRQEDGAPRPGCDANFICTDRYCFSVNNSRMFNILPWNYLRYVRTFTHWLLCCNSRSRRECRAYFLRRPSWTTWVQSSQSVSWLSQVGAGYATFLHTSSQSWRPSDGELCWCCRVLVFGRSYWFAFRPVFNELLSVSHLSLQLKCKAARLSLEYMLQRRAFLSNRNSVHATSVRRGLNSTVRRGETAISMNKQDVVNLYVPLLSRAPFFWLFSVKHY